jgi:4-diphosphocytidyl-2-C-methyl-D-erythritol kinase
VLKNQQMDLLPSLLANNLSAAAEAINSQITPLLTTLKASSGVLQALLCGSGSCVFALCADAETARTLADSFNSQGFWTWHGREGGQVKR